jgi:preprotein translocase subunit YajC
MSTLIIVVVVFLFAWLFLVLPSRRRQRSHQAMQDSVDEGDEIITAGGIHGIVREEGHEDIKLEIAPGVTVTLDRRAIAAVAEEIEPEEDEDEPSDEKTLDDAEDQDQAEETLRG